LGRDPATPFHVSPDVANTPVEMDLKTARETALRQRPDLHKAKLNVDYNDYNVSLKWAAFIPTVNLVVKYLAPITSNVLPKNIVYAGVQFDWDVFDWGGKLYDIDQMKKGVEQAKLAATDTEAQVLLNVNATFRALEDARSYLQVAELNRDAARAQLTLTQRDYAQQTALLKDLLSAQASLAAASDQYRQALLGLLDAQANFDKALGSGE
jgi:outer membrane protein TolC